MEPTPEPVPLTEYQTAILERVDNATALVVVAAALALSLLAIMAIRAIWS